VSLFASFMIGAYMGLAAVGGIVAAFWWLKP
jgi:hypothetical protein